MTRACQSVLWACWLAVALRATTVVATLTTLLAIASFTAWPWVYLGFLGLIVLEGGAYIALALALRCPACGRRCLIERNDKRVLGARYGAYGTIVMDVIRRRRFTCMYCATVCDVGRLTPGQEPQ